MILYIQKVTKLGKKGGDDVSGVKVTTSKKAAGIDAVLNTVCGGLKVYFFILYAEKNYKYTPKKTMEHYKDNSYLRGQPIYHILTFIAALAVFVFFSY